MPLKTFMDEKPVMDLTPMIDIVFQLVIFFMVGTKFVELERNMDLTVPQVSDAATLSAAPERHVINVYRDGGITLDRRQVTVQQLTQELAAARAEYARTGVVVRGDAQGAFQHVATVLGACRHAGIADMAVSVKPLENPRR